MASAVKTSNLGIKICVHDYDSFVAAVRDFRRLSRPTINRRHGHVRTDFYIKSSQLRRWRKGNAKKRALVIQRRTDVITPKKE